MPKRKAAHDYVLTNKRLKRDELKPSIDPLGSSLSLIHNKFVILERRILILEDMLNKYECSASNTENCHRWDEYIS